MFAQFGDDFFESFRLKDVGGFAQRAERGSLTAEFALNLPQFAGLFDGPQGADHGIEEEQQNEHTVLVVMELSISGFVALTADIMEACEQGCELVEILQARHVLFAHVIPAFSSHAGNYARLGKTRNTT